MNFKKMFLAITLCVALLTSCASPSTSDTENSNGDANEKTVINIWAGARHDAEYVQKKIDEYNAAHDDVEVVYTLYTDNFKQAIDMAIQGEELPDIVGYQSGSYNQYLSIGQWADLYPMMDDEMKEYFKASITPGSNEIDGKLYYIPTTGSTCRLFYNKEIFERVGVAEPPKTLAEMVEIAKKINSELSSEGIYGFAQNMKSAGSALNRSLLVSLQSATGTVQGYDFGKGEYTFEVWEDSLKLWKELLSPECAFPGTESLDIDPLRTQFAAGKIGMYFSYSGAEPGVFENQFPMDSEKWDAAPIPTADGKVIGKQNYEGSSAYMLNAKSKNLDKAYQVYKDIFLNEDYLIGYYEGGYGVSIVPEVIKKAKPSENYQNKEWLLIHPETDAIMPRAPHAAFQAGMTVEGQDLYQTAASIYYGDVDIKETLEDLSKRYNDAYKKAVENGTGYEIKFDNYDPMNPTLQ